MDLLNLFSPKVIETVHSPISGEVKVMKDVHTYYLATGYWTQSGGLIVDLWKPTLREIHPKKNASWLILGLSGGTAAQIISGKYSPSKIVGIEIDPVMIDLGRKYLHLGDIPNLEIKIMDANDYFLGAGDHFDYILVDMYIGENPPPFIYSPDFLMKLKTHSSTVVINHLFYTPAQKQAAEKLVRRLEKLFSTVRLYRKLTNLMIICESNKV